MEPRPRRVQMSGVLTSEQLLLVWSCLKVRTNRVTSIVLAWTQSFSRTVRKRIGPPNVRPPPQQREHTTTEKVQ
eukprot:6457384-Amphidinium_carterae.1